MGDIVVAIGSKETAVEDVTLLARKWLENPKIVAVSGPDIKGAVIEKSSALFIDGNLVLALLDPEQKTLQEVHNQLLTLKEKAFVIVYYTAAQPDIPAFLGKAPVQLEQNRDKRVRDRVLALTRARGKKMTDKAFAALSQRVKEESLLESELNKVLSYQDRRGVYQYKLDLSLILRHGFRLRKSMKENLSHGGHAPEVHARV